MTKSGLLTTLAQRLGKRLPLGSEDESRLLGMLNEVQREILSQPGMDVFRRQVVTFTSVANQALYGLANVAHVERIVETTNERILAPLTMAQYRHLEPDPSASPGTPYAFVWSGWGATALQPSNASSLFIQSTSASDTQVAYVEGEITGGYPRAVEVTLTGTTAVDVSSAISSWVRVSKFYLASAAVGTVTLHEDSGSGTELARIGVGQTSQRYWQCYLYPTPTEALPYTVDALLEISDLAGPQDEPRLPPDFHDVLVAGVMAREYEKTDDGRFPIADRRYRERVAQLKVWAHETASGRVKSYGGGTFLPLGPWFPRG